MEQEKGMQRERMYRDSDDISRELYIFAGRVLRWMNSPKNYGTGERIPTIATM